MKFENTEVWGFEHALRGMRNPKNSWNKSDSRWEFVEDITIINPNDEVKYVIGDNDMKLAKTLINGGSEHRKFLRQIFVSVDITAPLYWWKEFDTYKVGTVANSTSTMHKIASNPITLDCFETDDLSNVFFDDEPQNDLGFGGDVEYFICRLEKLRQKYLETNNKIYWKELIRWLPESWLQMRTVTMNYENLLAMCSKGQRRYHKLNEWSGIDDPNKPNFISWAKTLPYSEEFIFIKEDNNG